MKKLLETLSAFVVSQVLGDHGEKAVEWLQNYCADPGMALPQALDKALADTWQAVQLALRGDSPGTWLRQKFASGAVKAVSAALKQVVESWGDDFRQACLRELKQAAADGPLADAEWQKQCAGFARLAAPEDFLSAARQALARDA